MNSKLALVTFVLLMTLGMLGGQWSVVEAAPTIPEFPPEPPGGPIIVLIPVTGVIPVTGGAASVVASAGCNTDLDIGIDNVAFADFDEECCPKAGSILAMVVLPPEDVQTLEGAKPLTEVFQISCSDLGYICKVDLTVYLTDDEVAAFLKDAQMGLLRYDEENGKWVRLTAVLNGNTLTLTDVEVPGIFTVGKID